MVSALLAAGASPNLVHNEDADAAEAQPPLYVALTKGRFDAATLLLDARALAGEQEPVRQQTALHAACSGSCDTPLPILQSLLVALARSAADEKLDDIDIDDTEATASPPPPLPADSDGCTPLHSACASGRLESAQLLLQHTCASHEVRRASAKGVTPLAASLRRRHVEVARLLVREYHTPLDPTATFLCLKKGCGADVLAELAHAAAASAGDAIPIDARAHETGISALMLAAEAGETEAVADLLEMRADPAAADADGHTALMRAAFMGHVAIVKALLAAGCAVDQPDAKGNTALHHAGRGAQESMFDFLEMRYGADCELVNADGEVPKVQAEPCRIQ